MQEYIKKYKYNNNKKNTKNTTLIISNNDMKDLIKIVKSLEDSDLLLKGVTETVPNEIKEQKEDFLVCYYVH